MSAEEAAAGPVTRAPLLAPIALGIATLVTLATGVQYAGAKLTTPPDQPASSGFEPPVSGGPILADWIIVAVMLATAVAFALATAGARTGWRSTRGLAVGAVVATIPVWLVTVPGGITSAWVCVPLGLLALWAPRRATRSARR